MDWTPGTFAAWAEGRKALPKNLNVPERQRFEPDAVTREVMALVSKRFGDHFGDIEAFGWPVTRAQALAALGHFVADCLPRFGDYQDAMKSGQDFLFHALISPCLNLGLLGPREVEAWYLLVYADAFEWVELPNTHGMPLFADGGLMASKPYAASGAYINRMSDYCAACAYDPKQKLGAEACPFNYLYWNFLIVNEGELGANPRMRLAYRNLQRMDAERRAKITGQAQGFLERLR